MGVLFVQPHPEAVEVCPGHNVTLVALGQLDEVGDADGQQLPTTILELSVGSHDAEQLFETDVVVKDDGVCRSP